VNDKPYNQSVLHHMTTSPVIKVYFNSSLNKLSIANSIWLTNNENKANVPLNFTYKKQDSLLIIQPQKALEGMTLFNLTLSKGIRNTHDSTLLTSVQVNFVTALDTTDKFPRISD